MVCARILLVIVLGAASSVVIGCGSNASADARNAKANANANANAASEGLTMPTQAAPVGERLLDTGASNPAPPAARAPAPATTFAARPPVQKPGSDENLPKWVPVRGRLSVVGASDLAENLGLAPKGSSRSADTHVTVADALSQRTAHGAPAQPDAPRSATWLPSNGRVRHGRR